MSSLYGNKFIKYIVNNTADTLYVGNYNGDIYELPPNPMFSGLNKTGAHLYAVVESGDEEKSTRSYPPPDKGSPVFVVETNSMFYNNPEDLQKDILKYGSLQNVVRYYSTGEIGLYHGSGKLMLNLSENSYYIVDNGDIIEIPPVDESFRKQYIRHNRVTRDMSKNDLFIIYTYIAPMNNSNGSYFYQNSTERWLQKKPINILEPLFLDDMNLIVFNNKYAAERFITDFGSSISVYIRSVVMDSVRNEYVSDIESIQKEVKKDKVSIAKTASLVAASGAVGAAVKWLLDKIFAGAAPTGAASLIKPITYAGASTGNPLILFGSIVFATALTVLATILFKKLNGAEKLQALIEKIKATFAKVKESVKGFFSKIGRGIVNGVKAIGRGIASGVKAIGRGIGFVGRKIGEGLTSLGQKISGFFNRLCFWRT